MLSINDYLLEYKRRIPNILFLWMMILTFIIISVIIINKIITINNYYKVEAIVKNKSLSIYVLVKDLDKIVSNNELYIKNDKYNYSVEKISEELNINGTNFYKEIVLDINLEEDLLINNNIVEIKFIVKKMTIFEYIINLIKGE